MPRKSRLLFGLVAIVGVVISAYADLGLAERGPDGELAYDESQWVRAPQERLFIDGAWSEGLLPPADPGSATLAQYRRFAAAVAQVELDKALEWYAQRTRRFGMTTEQVVGESEKVRVA